MSESSGKAPPPPEATLRDKLIAAGEAMIGDRGLEGVSLRQISAAGGTRNNYAVQYHFEDLDGLIRAIIERQTPRIEGRRRQALDALDADGRLDTRTLLDAFFKPLIQFCDRDGLPRFARFMLALHRAADGWKPLDELFYMMPATEALLEQLHVANRDVPAPVIWQRLRPISVMVLTYTCSQATIDLPSVVREAIVESMIDMAAAALSVPVRTHAGSTFYGHVF